MSSDRPSLAEAILNWDREAYAAGPSAEAEQLRQQILAAFPLDGWPTLELQRYALGTGAPQTFSWWMEFGSAPLGSVGGGNARKHLVFRQG